MKLRGGERDRGKRQEKVEECVTWKTISHKQE